MNEIMSLIAILAAGALMARPTVVEQLVGAALFIVAMLWREK